MSTIAITAEGLDKDSVPFCTPEPQKPSTGFTDLPPEIRCDIYRQVLIKGHIRPKPLDPSDNPRHLALLLVCKLFYTEACDIVYKENCFAFGPGTRSKHVTFKTHWTAPTGPWPKHDSKDKSYKFEILKTADKRALRNEVKWRHRLVPETVSPTIGSDIDFFLGAISEANAKLIRHVQIQGFPWWQWLDNGCYRDHVQPILSDIERLPVRLESINIIMPDEIAKAMVKTITPSKDVDGPNVDWNLVTFGTVNWGKDRIQRFLTGTLKRLNRIRNVQEILVDHPDKPSKYQKAAKKFLREAGWKNVGDVDKVIVKPNPTLEFVEKVLGVDMRIWG